MSDLEAIVRRALPQARVVGSRELAGGISATTTAVEVLEGGAARTLVVRRIGEPTLATNPGAAGHEFAVRQAVAAAGIPTPAPLVAGDDPWPHLLLDYVEGAVELGSESVAAGVEQLASSLQRIHALDPEPLGFLPRFADEVSAKLAQRLTQLDGALQESRVRAELEAVWPLEPRNPLRVLHGDYWPGNVLWREGSLVAVIDWEDAALGDPLADLAITRLDLLFVAGAEVMHDFTTRYATLADVDLSQLPHWDLFAALRPAGHLVAWAAGMPALGRPDVDEPRMTALHRWFVGQAFEALGES